MSIVSDSTFKSCSTNVAAFVLSIKEFACSDKGGISVSQLDSYSRVVRSLSETIIDLTALISLCRL